MPPLALVILYVLWIPLLFVVFEAHLRVVRWWRGR